MPIFEYNCCTCHHSFEYIVLSPREKVSGCGCTPQTCGCH